MTSSAVCWLIHLLDACLTSLVHHENDQPPNTLQPRQLPWRTCHDHSGCIPLRSGELTVYHKERTCVISLDTTGVSVEDVCRGLRT
jgi:hypothetical protein